MYSAKSISLLKAAFSNSFKRNLSVTTATTKRKIADDIVLINDDESKENLRIQFNWGSKHKSIGFLRPKNEPISQSLHKFYQKIQTKILKNDEAFTDKELKLIDKESGESLVDHTWNEIILNLPKFRLRIQNTEYEFAHNQPLIFEVKIPEKSNVGFDVFPNRLDYVGDSSNLEFKWMIRKRKGKWSVCKTNNGSRSYHCVPDDAGSQLQLICEMYHGQVLTSVCKSNISKVDTNIVDMTAINERTQYTAQRLPDSKFRTVTYNLLADFYARSEYSKKVIFNYCDIRYLDGEYRNKVQLMELKGYNADLYCLQEVDETMFENSFKLFFELLGLNGIYRKKFKTDEGLAIFYNTDKFSLLADHSLVLNEALFTHAHLNDICNIVNANPNLKEKMNDLFNMAQILHLQCKTDPKKQIIVANTHLYSQPNCHVVRLIQLACILRHIEHIVHEEKEKTSNAIISNIVCGDFNSLPGHVLDSLMLEGNLSSPYQDYQDEIYKIENLNLSHSLKLSSACEKILFTNYSINFQWNTLDYIYHTNNLKTTQIVPTPDKKYLANKIPSEQFTSDHLALIADFDWCSENMSWFDKLKNGFKF